MWGTIEKFRPIDGNAEGRGYPDSAQKLTEGLMRKALVHIHGSRRSAQSQEERGKMVGLDRKCGSHSLESNGLENGKEGEEF